ncbi:MAG: outer membrane lipoprotein-sorting protein [Proteobacteria bacterium]|jgi:outer membrane lipoprotein-sorting protein|nr:outer membrane lipoprotein-sorting protein [Pseudomonadota bacterium]
MRAAFFIAPLLFPLAAWANGLTAEQVLEKSDAAQRAESSHTLMAQTITTTSGKERTFKIEGWTIGAGEKSVMRFVEPAPSAGIGMLSLANGDNIWAYFPDSDDLRKIASSSKNSGMEGSDFSYEDMTSGGEMSTSWEAQSVSDGEYESKACYVLVTSPKKASSYSKVLNWIDKETFVMHQAEYYDKKEKHIKTLTMSGWKQEGGTWTPSEMVMENLKRSTKTSIEMLESEFGVDVDEKKFTTAFLTTF